MNKKAVVRKPRLKFIDKLQQVLVDAGINVKRKGWEDYSFDTKGVRSEEPNDPCEWLDICTNEENGIRYKVQFYFSKNSMKLENVDVFIQKRKKGWKSEDLLSSAKKLTDDGLKQGKGVESL